ncbi:TPA: hypothetical protein ACGO7C_002198 [Streptococcus suis]
MRVRYLGETDPLGLTNGVIYDVISLEDDAYRIVDNSNEDYLYGLTLFEIVEE